MAKDKKGTGRHPSSPQRAAVVTARTVEAEEFRLVDRSGRVRARVELTRAGPRFAMMHEDETIALELVLTPDGPALRLMDVGGNTRLFVGALRGAARIGMADGDGAQRLFLGLGGKGTPALTLYDDSQRQSWSTGPAQGSTRPPARPTTRRSAQ
jgi:hypothetical protein